MNINATALQPKNNLVLLELPVFKNTITLKSGLELYFDDSFEKERHQTIIGTVISSPGRVWINEIVRKGKGLGYEKIFLDSQVLPGDIVYFDYQSVTNAKKWHEWGGYWEEHSNNSPLKRFMLIPYDQILFSIRDGEFVPINKTIVAERIKVNSEVIEISSKFDATQLPVEKTDSPILTLALDYSNYKTGKSKLELAMEQIRQDDRLSAKNKDLMLRKVEKAYENVREFTESGASGILIEKNCNLMARVKAAPAISGLNPGDVIIYEQESDQPIETSYEKSLDNEYFHMKIDEVFCVVREGNLLPYSNKVVIDPIIENTMGSFLIAERFRKKGLRGTIVHLGPLATDELAPGDKVYYNVAGAVTLDNGNVMVRDSEIIAKS